MKRITILITVFVLMTGAANAQNQEQDFYTLQFNTQATVSGKLRIVQNAAAEGTTTEFFAYALDVLVKMQPGIRETSEVKAADDLALLLAAKLGEAEYSAAGPNLWRTVDNFANPLVKAEALNALGKVQAMDFLPQVIQTLSDLNTEPGQDSQGRERIAFGAISSLEEYKDSSGYLPVFLASVGWYSDRVKSKAKNAMPKILENPTDPLISVITSSSYTYTIKYSALQVLEASQVTSRQKAQGAVAALGEAWRNVTNIGTQRTILINIRKLSLDMIRRYGTEDANVYPLLERSYREGSDEQEQISALAALSALASDDSARILSNFLNDMNTRVARGTLTREDERMVRVIIPALGDTGRPLARNALRRVLQEDWTGTVQRLAQDALKKIP